MEAHGMQAVVAVPAVYMMELVVMSHRCGGGEAGMRERSGERNTPEASITRSATT